MNSQLDSRPARLRESFEGVQGDEYAVAEEALATGVRPIAVPVRGALVHVLAAFLSARMGDGIEATMVEAFLR